MMIKTNKRFTRFTRAFIVLLFLSGVFVHAEITAKIVESKSEYAFDNSDYSFLQEKVLLKLRQNTMISEMRFGLLGNLYSHDKLAHGLYEFQSNSGGLLIGSSFLFPQNFTLNTDLSTWLSNEKMNYKFSGSLDWSYDLGGMDKNQKLTSSLEGEVSSGYGSPLKRKLAIAENHFSFKMGAEMNYWDGMIGVMKVNTSSVSIASTALVLANLESAKEFDANQSTIAYAYTYAKLFANKLRLGLSAKWQNSLHSTNYYYQKIDPSTAMVSTTDFGNFPYYSPVNALSLAFLIGNSIDLSNWTWSPFTSIKTQLLVPLYSEEDYQWEASYAESLESVAVQQGFYQAKGTAPLEVKIELAKQINEQFWISGVGTAKIKPYSDQKYLSPSAYSSYEYLVNLSYWW